MFSWQNMKNIQIALFFLATNVEHSESHCFFLATNVEHSESHCFFCAKYVEHSKLCSSVLCRGEKHAQEDKRKMRQTELDGGRQHRLAKKLAPLIL